MSKRITIGMLSVVVLIAAVCATTVAAAETINTDPKQQLPDPDGKPADMSKPIKVFILLGQSNMLGFGRIDPEDKNGTLSHAVKAKKKYPHLIDDAGNALGWAMADLLKREDK